MVQMVTQDAGVVTVADLLSRYAPAPPVDPEPATVPVSVGSLLRREGRAPHAPDRPVQPRSHQDDAAPDDDTRRAGGVLVRRSAIAAGTLLAAGAVFGAAVVDDASLRGDSARTQAGSPELNRLDLVPRPAGAVPTIVDPAARSTDLDAGVDAPSSWMTTAFPDTSTAGGGAPAATAAPVTASSPAGNGGPVTGETDQRVDAPSVRDDADRNGGVPSGTGPTGGSDDRAPVGDERSGGGLGGAVEGVGDGVGGPIGGTVSTVGGVVDGAGDTLTDAGDDSVVGSVAELAGGLL